MVNVTAVACFHYLWTRFGFRPTAGRRCLILFLLTASRAHVSGRLNINGIYQVGIGLGSF